MKCYKYNEENWNANSTDTIIVKKHSVPLTAISILLTKP